MTLGDVLSRLEELDDELSIYAERRPEWSPESRAVLVDATDEASAPPEEEGLEYFLEVDLAREAVEVWSQWRDGATPTPEDRFAAVTHYAVYDAYLPVEGEGF